MALERLEKSVDFIIVLREATNHYLAFLDKSIKEKREEAKGVEGVAAQAAEISAIVNRAKQEAQAFAVERAEVEKQTKTIQPYLEILDKIAHHKTEIRDKEREIRLKAGVMRELKRAAAKNRQDEIAQNTAHSSEITFLKEKTFLDLEISRAAEELVWQQKRLSSLGVDEEAITTQYRRIKTELAQIDDTIEKKNQTAEHYKESLNRMQFELKRLRQLDLELATEERSYSILMEATKIIGEVSLDATALTNTKEEPVSVGEPRTC